MVESGYKSSLLTDQDVLVLNDHLATVHYHLKIIIEYRHGIRPADLLSHDKPAYDLSR